MSLLSGGGGDDRMQIGMAVFAVVLSLTVSLLVPVLAPGYDTDTNYSYQDIYLEKANLEAYTGESMTNLSPWKLTGVYTPWTLNDSPDQIDPETGWAYGESVAYPDIGKTSGIRLDPDYRSDTPLYPSKYTNIPWEHSVVKWYYQISGTMMFLGGVLDYLGVNIYERQVDFIDINSWSYTGYRYEFDPMLKIDYTDNSHNYSTASQSDAKLSIVWYKDSTTQGISGGLILYNNSTNGIVANIQQDDILSRYNTNSGYSTRYMFDFNGVQVYLNFRFDQDVIASSTDLAKAFDDGRWSIAITAASMDNWMDLSSSNSLSSSVANLLDTYIKIFTFSFPTLDLLWSMVLWIVCILPIQLTVLMFLSRFGVIGVGIGVLGTALLTAFGLAV